MSLASTAASFIPEYGGAISAGITGTELAMEAADDIWQASQAKNLDMDTMIDIMGGNYKGDTTTTTNTYGGDYSGNYDYGRMRF
jgi:hypothetical protein